MPVGRKTQRNRRSKHAIMSVVVVLLGVIAVRIEGPFVGDCCGHRNEDGIVGEVDCVWGWLSVDGGVEKEKGTMSVEGSVCERRSYDVRTST